MAEGTIGIDCAFSVRGLSRGAGEREVSRRLWTDTENKVGQLLVPFKDARNIG